VITRAGSLGVLLVQLLMTVAVSAILYARGETVVVGVLAFAAGWRESRENGSPSSPRGRFGRSRLGSWSPRWSSRSSAASGSPSRASLCDAADIGHVLLAVAQIGTGAGAARCCDLLYASGATFWGTVMVVWSLVTMSLDNILRPVLIRKGADLPLILISRGDRRLLAFGLIGLFVGPVVLAVTYTLLRAWVAEGDATRRASGSSL